MAFDKRHLNGEPWTEKEIAALHHCFRTPSSDPLHKPSQVAPHKTTLRQFQGWAIANGYPPRTNAAILMRLFNEGLSYGWTDAEDAGLRAIADRAESYQTVASDYLQWSAGRFLRDRDLNEIWLRVDQLQLPLSGAWTARTICKLLGTNLTRAKNWCSLDPDSHSRVLPQWTLNHFAERHPHRLAEANPEALERLLPDSSEFLRDRIQFCKRSGYNRRGSLIVWESQGVITGNTQALARVLGRKAKSLTGTARRQQSGVRSLYTHELEPHHLRTLTPCATSREIRQAIAQSSAA